MKMARRDRYYNQAKQEGYRSRAAYKLKQLDELEPVLPNGGTIVDLGAAPGGWLQVAAERVGPAGTVIGVDRQRIKELPELESKVITIRGDMTEKATHDEINELVGKGGVDTVLSDMAPNMTGEYTVDHARSVYLAQQAATVARNVLAPGGNLVVKVFDGPDLADVVDELERDFTFVRRTTPKASRKESSEIYLIAKGFLTAPVRKGDVRTVTIEALGRQGDGIAKIEGYTVFVPETEPGETLDIEIEAVKVNFGFGQRITTADNDS